MEYRYLIFEDEKGKVFILRDLLLKDCVFAGSVGKLKLVESGILTGPDFLKQLFEKKEEYLLKKTEKIEEC